MGAENAWHAFAFIRARVVVFVVVVRGTRHRSNDIACVCSPRCPRTTSCGSNAPWTRGTSTEAGTRFREWNHSFATPNARRDDDAGCVRTKGADEARRWVDTSTRAGSGPSSRPSVESVIRRGISRRQYGGSRLRAGIEVTRAEVTEGMLMADRRYAPRSWGLCRDCGVTRVARGRDACERCRRLRGLRPDATAAATRRSCRECGEDISNRPASHTVCLRCYRRGSFGSTSSPGRMLHTGYAVPGYAVPLRQETDTESESDSEWEII